MEVAFCSMLLPEEKNLAQRTRGHLSGVSLHKFTRSIIQGVDANLERPVKVFNIINTLNYPNFPDLTFPTEQWSHAPGSQDWHIGYINLFGIKYITQARNLYRKLDRWCRERKGEPCVICVHHIYLPAMWAACKLKRKYGGKVKLCLITGDMPGEYGLPSQDRKNLKERLLVLVGKRIFALARQFDSFVFATKHMAEGFGVQEKPYVVLECAYSEPAYQAEVRIPNPGALEGKKIIFYAGSLRKEYGILHLLRAFSLIRDPDYRLWLAGGGNAEEQIRAAAEQDSRITFLGFIPPQEVAWRQQAATVLVSPRTPEGNFVKYSFPSKTMECLASGKPYVAHRLPCEPPEYANYIQYAEVSDRGLRDKLVEVCELPPEKREEIGRSARTFILNEKNPKSMGKRIVDLWTQMLTEE